jgi:ApbE superfamily uncharacterized protein (UPF0280 family)
MNARAQIRRLPDGRRVHMHDGPIDLIVEAFGPAAEIEQAYDAAANRFVSILDELCTELSFLRRGADEDSDRPQGIVARRMLAAVQPYATRHFITPMAAVAGAVAEEILGTMARAALLSRAYVNNGGDIAMHLTPGETFDVGMVERPDHPSLFGTARISGDDLIRGIATSGWRGRSFSRGIADAVTVLADTASAADAAATIIANAVNLADHPGIERTRACDLAPESDLGDRLVTTSVAPLTANEIHQALDAGVREAKVWLALGLIRAVAIRLQGEIRTAGALSPNAMMLSSTSGSLAHA